MSKNSSQWKVCLVERKTESPPYRIIITDGWLTEYPIKYPNGKIAYDNPEQIPIYTRTEVEVAFKTLENIEQWKKNAEETLPFYLLKK